MRGVGDIFTKLLFSFLGILVALGTSIFAFGQKEWPAFWLACFSFFSGLLLVILTVQEIRVVLNVLFKAGVALPLDKNTEGESEIAPEPALFSGELKDIEFVTEPSYQFIEVYCQGREAKETQDLSSLYKKIFPLLNSERGLLMVGSESQMSGVSGPLQQVLKGHRDFENVIEKEAFPQVDLFLDTQLSFLEQGKSLEKLLLSLRSDYYRILIVVRPVQEEFYRKMARKINLILGQGQNKNEWMSIPAIKRKRPVSYQSLSRFEPYNSRNIH